MVAYGQFEGSEGKERDLQSGWPAWQCAGRSSLVAGDSEAWSKKGFRSNSVSERSSASDRAANSSIDPAPIQPFTGTLHNADSGLQFLRCFSFSRRHAASRHTVARLPSGITSSVWW